VVLRAGGPPSLSGALLVARAQKVCWNPSCSTRFLGSSLLKCGSSTGILRIPTQSLYSSTFSEEGVPAYRDHSTFMPWIWVIYPS
jgi:hypothetical protein